MQSQINCHLWWGKKGGEICFGLDFSIPEALLSSDPEVQGSVIPGRCFSDAEHRAGAPWRRRWRAPLIPGLFKEQSSGTRVKSQLPARQGSTKGRGNLSRSISMHQPTACPAQGLAQNPNFR